MWNTFQIVVVVKVWFNAAKVLDDAIWENPTRLNWFNWKSHVSWAYWRGNFIRNKFTFCNFVLDNRKWEIPSKLLGINEWNDYVETRIVNNRTEFLGLFIAEWVSYSSQWEAYFSDFSIFQEPLQMKMSTTLTLTAIRVNVSITMAKWNPKNAIFSQKPIFFWFLEFFICPPQASIRWQRSWKFRQCHISTEKGGVEIIYFFGWNFKHQWVENCEHSIRTWKRIKTFCSEMFRSQNDDMIDVFNFKISYSIFTLNVSINVHFNFFSILQW